MTAFDYAVLAVIAASALLGLWRGVVGEVLALAAWVVAFFVARADRCIDEVLVKGVLCVQKYKVVPERW